MKIYIGADHRGFALKEKLKKYLAKQGFEVSDMGAAEFDENDDYPDFGKRVGETVAQNPDSCGILLCGSGVGICIAANRIRGVRAVQADNLKILKAVRQDDDVNILCLASDFISFAKAKKFLEIFLNTPFEKNERHERRIGKLDG